MATCDRCKTYDTELYDCGVPVCLACSSPAKPIAAATNQDIHSRLTREMLEATVSANSASLELHRVSEEIPSGLPLPDGTQRIRNASRQLNTAQNKLMDAHNRLDAFLSDGIIPPR